MSSELTPLFSGSASEIQGQRDAAAVARAVQEVQAALVIAQRFPRDEIKAIARILEACKRKELAEIAEYEYPRGGTRITGPTIDLLRAVANRWGNIRFGWVEVERRDGESTVRTFAWDLQSNGQAERTFVVAHRRDKREGGVDLTDERDIYELLANMAARRVRACLQEVIDADVLDKAVDQCRRTLREGEKVPLKDRVVQMLNFFIGDFQVSKEMLEARLGNSLESISENQFASLRRVYKSLKDGIGKREDFFKAPVSKPEQAPTGAPVPSPTTSPEDEKAEAAAGLAPEQPKAPATPAPETPTNRYLVAVRGLCKAGGIGEGQLLGFLSEIGLTDGSCATLEELSMLNPKAIQEAHDKWAGMAKRIKEMVPAK